MIDRNGRLLVYDKQQANISVQYNHNAETGKKKKDGELNLLRVFPQRRLRLRMQWPELLAEHLAGSRSS